MDLRVGRIRTPLPAELEVEVVERKGVGHPDTICDGLAERFSATLSQYCLGRFHQIPHHNVDKVLLVGGSARPRFGGGRVLSPMRVYLAGRAAEAHRGVRIPVADLALAGARDWFREHLRALDPVRHVDVQCLTRPGSAALAALLPDADGTVPLANDTSVGVGFWPETPLERAVRAVERRLNAHDTQALHPEIGEDIKVLGIRRASRIALTVACAFLDRALAGLPAYRRAREEVGRLAVEAAAGTSGLECEVQVNTADDPGSGRVYLTVTGTSAEAGDDGEAGRGNRANGLITPYRPMSMECAPGKNPVSHVGKLYQIAAGQVARRLVERRDGIESAECWMVSRIGAPVDRPQVIDVKVSPAAGVEPVDLAGDIEATVGSALAAIPSLWRESVAGGFSVY